MSFENEKPFANLSSFQLDTQLREVIGLIWLILPDEKQDVKHLREEVLSMVNDALDDFQTKVDKFGR